MFQIKSKVPVNQQMKVFLSEDAGQSLILKIFIHLNLQICWKKLLLHILEEIALREATSFYFSNGSKTK